MGKNIKFSWSYVTTAATTIYDRITISVSLQKFLDYKYLQL